MKSFIAGSNSLDMASGGGNGDAAAERPRENSPYSQIQPFIVFDVTR